MLYGRDTISEDNRSNIPIWMTLAFQAGVINIGGFMACHRFVSHVTGFATFFGVEMSRSHYFDAIGMLAVPLFFLVGVMISGQLVDIRIRKHLNPQYHLTFGFIFILILIVFFGGVFNFFGSFGTPLDLKRDYLLLALLCLACGVQNGTISTVSKSMIRTTHLTGITTDFGLGLIRLANRGRKGLECHGESRATMLRLGIIFFFGLGSILGGVTFAEFGYLGFLLPVFSSGGLFALMLYFYFFPRSSRS